MKIDYTKNISLSDTKKVKLISLGLYLPKDRTEGIGHFIKWEGNYYFYKWCSNNMLINELLGSYFCNQIGLDAV